MMNIPHVVFIAFGCVGGVAARITLESFVVMGTHDVTFQVSAYGACVRTLRTVVTFLSVTTRTMTT